MAHDRQDHHQPDDETLKFDQRVREQLVQGCKLAKELEEKLDAIPPGKLGEANSKELRFSFAIGAVDVIATFNETIKLLISSCGSASTSSSGASPSQQQRCNNLSPRAHSKRPFSEETPPLSPLAMGAPMVKRVARSPPHSNNMSPTSEMSDGSPTAGIRILELEKAGDQTAENDHGAAGGGNSRNKSDARDNPRKTKLLPKVMLKMPASNLEQGAEIPPDDGHTWRKYGQKDILGAKYPRSYYRCTHKSDVGCQAIKQVQRCDDDAGMCEVTYRGHHTCRSSHLDSHTWPFAFQHPFLQVPPQVSMQCLQASHSLLPQPSSSPPIATSSAITPRFGPPLAALDLRADLGLRSSNSAGFGFTCSSSNACALTAPMRTIDLQTRPPSPLAGFHLSFADSRREFLEPQSRLGAAAQPAEAADDSKRNAKNFGSRQPRRPVSPLDWSMFTTRDQSQTSAIHHLLQSLAAPNQQIPPAGSAAATGTRACAAAPAEGPLQKMEAVDEFPTSSSTAFDPVELLLDSPLNRFFMDSDPMADKL